MAHQPTKQQRQSPTQGRSARPQQAPNRLTLQVGEKWPDGITTEIETVPAQEAALRRGVIIAIVAFCGVLIAMLTVHAIVTGNQQRLDTTLRVAWKVLIGFGLWAIAAHHWDKLKAALRKATYALRE